MQTLDSLALATEVAALAADLKEAGNGDVGPLAWDRIGSLAVTYVPGCTWAGVCGVAFGPDRHGVASDPVAEHLDNLQRTLGEGPSLLQELEAGPVLSADLEAERRWPTFVARARAETQVQGILAVRVPCREAAMTFYADKTGALDADSVEAAEIVSAHAANLLILGDLADRSRQLMAAVASNRQIGIAMGMLMVRHKVSPDEAFTLLRVSSQRLNRKLRDIAVEVAESGTLPGLPSTRRSAAQ